MKFKKCGLRVVQCPSDADTTIVKTAVNRSESVTVYSDDTDVLCLLIHHFDPSLNKEIFLCNMTKRTNQARECFSIRSLIEDMDVNNLRYLLFAHAFTGCDTTSAIHRFGKLSIFKKLTSAQVSQIANEFYESEKLPEDIGDITIRLFEFLYSSSGQNLHQIRKKKYQEMVMSNRSKIDPSSLPPSPRAAYFHGLRVYHQLKIWIGLHNTDLEPCKWGWKLKDDCLSPIMTDIEPGPPNLLKIVRCRCKSSCDKRCSCRKSGLKCSASCNTLF